MPTQSRHSPSTPTQGSEGTECHAKSFGPFTDQHPVFAKVTLKEHAKTTVNQLLQAAAKLIAYPVPKDRRLPGDGRTVIGPLIQASTDLRNFGRWYEVVCMHLNLIFP